MVGASGTVTRHVRNNKITNGREWGNVCMHKRGMSGASGTVARHVRTGRLYEKMSNCIKF